MVTGIMEVLTAYQLVQPLVEVQIKLIHDIVTTTRYIRKLVHEYKTRFDSLKDLADDCSGQYVYLKKLVVTLEQLSQGNNKSLDLQNKEVINKDLASLDAQLTRTMKDLQSYQDCMLESSKDSSVVANSVATAKRFIGSFEYINEGRALLEKAISVSDTCCNKITLRLMLFLSLNTNKISNDLYDMGEGVHEPFKAINVNKITMDLPITRFVKRVIKARERAESVKNLSKNEMMSKLISPDDLQFEIMEDDTDYKYGRRLERTKANSLHRGHLIDGREIQGDKNQYRDMRQALFLCAILSDDSGSSYTEKGQKTIKESEETDGEKREGAKDAIGLNRLLNTHGGLPKCVGVIDRIYSGRFDLMFEIPTDTKMDSIMSLRKALTDPAGALHPLDDRYKLALRVAECVYLVHSAGLIHKFIRPESFLLMEEYGKDDSELYPHRLGDPYLFGYGQVREDNMFTDRKTFNEYPRRVLLYRSPRHQDQHDNGYRIDRYRMKDDIYSLGICLLEIGLWKSFFKPQDGTYKEDRDMFDFTVRSAKQMMNDLIELARKELPRVAGLKYTEIVVQILSCFNNDKTKFPHHESQPAEMMRAFENIVLKELRTLVYNSGGVL